MTAMTKQKKSALMKAADLLAYREHSEAQLKRKLLARRYDTSEVDATIDKLKRHHYLDDAELCRQQFDSFWADGRLSVRQIVVKLIQRGFDKDFIAELIPADRDEHELHAAILALTKKFTTRDENFRAKAWQFLSTRGFDGDIISTAIENFSERG